MSNKFQDRQRQRIDQLTEIGMRFNGEEFVGSDELKDFNVHHTETLLDSDAEWERKIADLKAEKERRLNKKS
jgi:hypothetical protein